MFIVLEGELHLEIEDLLVLLLGLRGEPLVVVEEAGGCGDDLQLVDAPLVAQILQDLVLLIQYRDCSLMGNIVKTHDTVGDTLGLNDTDPTDFRGVVAVSTAAGLSVDAIDVDDSEGVAWNDTSLVEVETVLLLSFCLIHEVLVDSVAVVDDSVSLILNSSLLILSDALIVSDVEVSALDGLLGTVLPDVRAEYLAAGGEDDVSAGVMCSQLLSALLVDVHVHGLALEALPVGQLPVHDVQHHLAHLLCVHYLKGLLNSIDFDFSGIVLLTTRSGIDCALVKDHNVTLAAIKNVGEYIYNFGIEVHQVVVLVVKIISLR